MRPDYVSNDVATARVLARDADPGVPDYSLPTAGEIRNEARADRSRPDVFDPEHDRVVASSRALVDELYREGAFTPYLLPRERS